MSEKGRERDREMGEEKKKDCKKKKKEKKANVDREVLTRVLTELSSREIKKTICMDGRWISTLIKKKKKVSRKVKVNQNGLFQNFFLPLSLSLFLYFSILF